VIPLSVQGRRVPLTDVRPSQGVQTAQVISRTSRRNAETQELTGQDNVTTKTVKHRRHGDDAVSASSTPCMPRTGQHLNVGGRFRLAFSGGLSKTQKEYFG